MTIYGWDASDYDWSRGPMDLKAAKDDGIKFFTHKATEGTTVKHKHYGEALTRAKNAGLEFMGPYGIPRTPGGSQGTIAEQVNYFLSYVNSDTPWWKDIPGFFFQCDLEKWQYDAVKPQYGVEWCSRVHDQTGRTVLLYAPSWAYGDSITGTVPLWASNYGTNPAQHYTQAYPGDNSSRWKAYSGRIPVVLQYGSQTIIGSQHGCDANAFRGTVDDFRTLILGATMTATDVNVQSIFDGFYKGGSSCGSVVPTEFRANADSRGNGLVDKLNYFQALLEKLPTITAVLSDAQVQAIADKLVASQQNSLTAADHAALIADIKEVLNNTSLHA